VRVCVCVCVCVYVCVCLCVTYIYILHSVRYFLKTAYVMILPTRGHTDA
jgi:hypothetical protein